MRKVFHALIHELGYEEGKSVFEWYCKVYNLTIADEPNATILHEVFGL